MNGKDGKPFKTRDGGVMKLSDLISDINEEMRGKIASNPEIGTEICPTRPRRTIFSISRDSLLSRETQVLISCTPS